MNVKIFSDLSDGFRCGFIEERVSALAEVCTCSCCVCAWSLRVAVEELHGYESRQQNPFSGLWEDKRIFLHPIRFQLPSTFLLPAIFDQAASDWLITTLLTLDSDPLNDRTGSVIGPNQETGRSSQTRSATRWLGRETWLHWRMKADPLLIIIYE